MTLPTDATGPRELRPPLVVLVHGFLRTGISMLPLAWELRRQGLDARVLSQPNLLADIPTLAEALHLRLERLLDGQLRGAEGPLPLDFVTHSMGGIVVRSLLARYPVPGARRLVMLAPPNQGSRYAEQVHDGMLRLPWGRFDPLAKLLPGARGQCESAGEPDVEVGIIAGVPRRPTGLPWSALRLPGWSPGLDPGGLGQHDGKVAVDEAQWSKAADFLVVPYGHSFLMNHREVQRQCVAFLRDGRFERAAAAP